MSRFRTVLRGCRRSLNLATCAALLASAAVTAVGVTSADATSAATALRVFTTTTNVPVNTPVTFVAQLVDASGVAVDAPNVSLTWDVGVNGSFSSVTTTNANGVATAVFTPTAIINNVMPTVSASSPNVSGVGNTFSVTNATVGTAQAYVVETSALTETAGGQFTVFAQYVDANGIAVDTPNVPLTWSTSDNGSFSSVTTTNADGVGTAVFTTNTTAATGQSVGARDSWGHEGTSNSFSTTAGAAAKLVVTSQPNASVSSGGSLGSITVKVEDANTNVVTTSAATITVGSSGGTLGGVLTIAATNGVATFSTLALSAGTGIYTLTFTSGSLTSALSNSISLTGIRLSQSQLGLASTTTSFGTPLALRGIGGSGAGAWSYGIVSPGTAGCSLSANLLSATSVGTCTVELNKASDGSFASADAAVTITVRPAAQPSLSVVVMGHTLGTAWPLSVTGGSGAGTVTYSVVDGTAQGCALVGLSLRAMSPGTCIVRATKAGNTDFLSASSQTTVDFTFPPRPPVIAVSFAASTSSPIAFSRDRLNVLAAHLLTGATVRVMSYGFDDLALARSRALAIERILWLHRSIHVRVVLITNVHGGVDRVVALAQ